RDRTPGYRLGNGQSGGKFAWVRPLRRTKFDSRPYAASPRNNDGVWSTSISLSARLCHLAARLAHSGGCGIRHQPRVAENRAELVSLAETSNGRLGSIGMHARDLTALAGPRPGGLDRRPPTSGSSGSRVGVFPILSERSEGPT